MEGLPPGLDLLEDFGRVFAEVAEGCGQGGDGVVLDLFYLL